MASKSFIRYFCRVTPHEGDALGDLSFRYFCSMVEAGHKIRVIPTNMADVAASESRWELYGAFLVAPIANEYINVVCGSEEELDRLYTGNVKNIAIVQSEDQGKDVLKKYDCVLHNQDGLIADYL